ncbi:hypothetical protein OIU84_007838 [Salix udensis]|uniref:Uncharacterized protein n=1 Tax=Salix udensis TaxID=889485 RepID=A0AAD6JTQ6_9ROSI|nr:hypothetical protein OIU84_007838 [Salix udensis]
MPSLLVCLSYMQILQGNPESGGSGEEVQEPVVFPRLQRYKYEYEYLQICYKYENHVFASSISSIFCASDMYFS